MKKIEIPVYAITVKDENSGEERTIHTVRTVESIVGYLEETEREALGDVVDRIDYGKKRGES